jgi:chromosomal replication initiator protein
VAAEWGITREQLLSRSHEPRYAHPRVLAMQLARELTKASYPTIGRNFQRDHSTVMHAQKRAHDLIDAKPELVDRRNAVLARLGLSPSRQSLGTPPGAS